MVLKRMAAIVVCFAMVLAFVPQVSAMTLGAPIFDWNPATPLAGWTPINMHGGGVGAEETRNVNGVPTSVIFSHEQQGISIAPGTANTGNFVMDANIMFTAGTNAGFVFRLAEIAAGSQGGHHAYYNTGYTLHFIPENNTVRLLRTPGDNIVASVTMPILMNRAYAVRVVAFENRIYVFVDDMIVPVITYVYDNPGIRISGEIGIFNIWSQVAFFDINVNEVLDFTLPVAPIVENVEITGHHTVNSILTMDYVWSTENTHADASDFQWFRLSSGFATPPANWNGVDAVSGWTPIGGAVNRQYTITPADVGSQLAAVMFPENSLGMTSPLIFAILDETVVEWIRPFARNVSISGDVAVGLTLTGSFDYESYRNIPQGSTTFRWLSASNIELTDLVPIPGETGQTLLLTPELADRVIVFEVTPRSQPFGGMPSQYEVGEATLSGLVVRPMPPEALNVRITSDRAFNRLQAGDVLEAEYDFFSINNAAEDGTTFQWQRRASGEANFVDIAGAVNQTYTLTAADNESSIRVVVTPRREALSADPNVEIRTGTPVASTHVMTAHPPVASDVRITGSAALNGRLTGSYTFYQANGNVNYRSVYRWFRDGMVISNANGREYFITQADLGRTIYFEVTPRTDVAPFYGTPVRSAGIRIPQTSNLGGSGGVGGDRGWVTAPINNQDAGTSDSPGDSPEDPYVPTEVAVVAGQRDIYGHWAVESLVRAINIGIMQGDGGYMRPNDFVTRAEFITILIRAIDAPMASEGSTFADVDAGAWYSSAVATAAAMGLAQGDGTNFRPNDTITREEMTAIIMNAYQVINGNLPEGDNEINFEDADDISDWALSHIAAAIELEFVNGVSDTQFAPRGLATRAQACVIILRVLDRIGGNQ